MSQCAPVLTQGRDKQFPVNWKNHPTIFSTCPHPPEHFGTLNTGFRSSLRCRASSYLAFVNLGLRADCPLPVQTQWAQRALVGRKTIPDDFSDNSAASQSLCYTQGSAPEEYNGRGKQIPHIRDFCLFPWFWRAQRPAPRRWRRRSGWRGRRQRENHRKLFF